MPDADRATFARESAWLADTLREAGAIACKLFRTDLKHWTKGASSPVSEADIAVNDLIRAKLREAFPDDGWLSEESEADDSRLNQRRIWIVDPIDGTRAYIAGRDEWALSAALVVDGRPVVGAVFAPVYDDFFAASAGAGATLNGAAIRVSQRAALEGAEIAGSRRLLEEAGLGASGARLTPRAGSLALRLARVAQGAMDATIVSPNSHDWDLAAADLLVHEAGGVMSGLTSGKIVYNRPRLVHGLLVAAGEPVHADLLGHFRGRGWL